MDNVPVHFNNVTMPASEWASLAGYPNVTKFLDDVGSKGFNQTLDTLTVHKRLIPGRVEANKEITYGGVSRTVTQWAELLELKVDTLRKRFSENWTLYEIMETPPGQRRASKKGSKEDRLQPPNMDEQLAALSSLEVEMVELRKLLDGMVINKAKGMNVMDQLDRVMYALYADMKQVDHRIEEIFEKLADLPY